jgi:hypothetical protein
MWRQPTQTQPSTGRYAGSLPAGAWGLLVRLPPGVLAAALNTRAEPPSVPDGLAGLAAIAAARTSTGVLVREVVAAIFAAEDGPGAVGTVAVPPDAVVAECTAAGQVLAQRVPTAEAAEYRRWVLHVARVACHDDPLTAAQRRLLDDVERALAG